MVELPSGAVTFLFTDIEGSTRLWEQQPEAMRAALARHDTLLRQVIERHGGSVFKTMGDQFCAAFSTAAAGLAAAAEAQGALQSEGWERIDSLRVRMALNTGAAEERDGDYFGPPLNRVARLLEVGHGGQILLSLATQQLVRDQLPEGAGLRDLGERRLKDLLQPERIFQLLHPDLSSEFPPLATLGLNPTNLPAQPTPLIGRASEVAAALELVRDDDVRLLTLTGPGGTGKTRLGLQIAAHSIDDFQDGVFFVALAPVTDRDLLVSTIAQALGVRDVGAQALSEELKQSLRDRQMLLLLDNFEQVLAAAPLVAELLAASPRLKVLVTSRARLRLRGEQEFPVPPLAVPDPGQLPPVEALSQFAAVELFVQRARNVRPDFALTAENAATIAEICWRLNGLPLAIELAAARIKLLPLPAMLARMGSRLKLLTGGAQDLPARQQTLRNAIAWSYDLLDEREQRLFRRLSVFVGGCSLEAAEAVCETVVSGQWIVDSSGRTNDTSRDAMLPVGRTTNHEPLSTDLLDGIASLVDKSLLQQREAAGGEPRFTMLETIREFGLERLVESGEAEQVRRLHAQFFMASGPPLAWGEQDLELDRVAEEHDNIRAALSWSLETGEAELGLSLAQRLARFWYVRGHCTEGREQLAKLLALPTVERQTESRWQALRAAAGLAMQQDDDEAARALTEESLAIRRELGDQAAVASGCIGLAITARNQGDYEAACSHLQEGLVLAQAIGDRRLTCQARCQLGYVRYLEGDLSTARTLLEQTLPLARQLAHEQFTGWNLTHLAEVAGDQRDLDMASAYLEQAMVVWQSTGTQIGLAWSLHKKGRIAWHRGDLVAAGAAFAESLALWRGLGSGRRVADCLEGLASVAAGRGRQERACRLFGAAQTQREAGRWSLAPVYRAEYGRQVMAVRDTLGEEGFAAAWAEGRALSREQVIRYALEGTAEGSGTA